MELSKVLSAIDLCDVFIKVIPDFVNFDVWENIFCDYLRVSFICGVNKL